MLYLFYIKQIGIAFITCNKSNSGESFWKMGWGEENLFSKRFLPHKTVLQHPHFRQRK